MFSSRFDDLARAVASCVYSTSNSHIPEDDALKMATKLIALTPSLGGIVYVIGNGGSAGIASHFSTDLLKALQIPSQTLYDSNLMTCLSNDWGYENVFSYPLGKLLRPSDLLVAISSSGKSENILKAVAIAQAKRCKVITLSGFGETNPLRSMGTLNFWIDRSDYGLVETSHFFLLHTIIDLWKKSPSTVKEYDQVVRNVSAK